MPSIEVSTSATTTVLPSGGTSRGGAEIVYETADASRTYTVEPHPPTPREPSAE
jgi:hypothetical protein